MVLVMLRLPRRKKKTKQQINIKLDEEEKRVLIDEMSFKLLKVPS